MSLEFFLKASAVAGELPDSNQLAAQEIGLNYSAEGVFLCCTDSEGAVRRLNEVWVGAAPGNPTRGLLWFDNTDLDESKWSLKIWISPEIGWKIVGTGGGPGPGPGPGGGVQSITIVPNCGLNLAGSSANPVIGTDTTVVRTTNDQTILGTKTFTDPIIGDLTGTADNAISALSVKKTITGGIGLAGGGELTSNVTLDLDIATNTLLGGVKIGNGLKIAADGLLSSEFPQIFNNKGSIDVTKATAPAAPEDGDFYINTVTGTASASWIGIAGQNVAAGEIVLFVKSTNQWEAAGGLVTGVIEVISGDGISVVNPKSPSPQVNVNNTVVRSTRKILTPGEGLSGGGTLNQDLSLALSPATKISLGGVIPGDNINIKADGTISVALNPFLEYKGTVDPNGNAPSPVTIGDVYIASAPCPEVNSSWIGLYPKEVLLHQLLIWNGDYWSGAGRVDSIGVDSILSGDGITVDDPLSHSPTVNVNASVVRTEGNQKINGVKTFNSTIVGDISGNASTSTNALFAEQANKLTRLITPSDGIKGGGELTQDITLQCDSTVIRDFGAQTIAGVKTFTSTIVGDISGNAKTADNALLADDAVKCQRSITGTNGIQGGGTLETDQVLEVDITVVRTTGPQTIADVKTFTSRIVGNITGNAATADNALFADNAGKCDRRINANDGLSGGGQLSGDVSITCDSTVVRTSGNQTINDQKTFTTRIVGDITGNANTANNANYADNSGKCDRSVNTGNGLRGGGRLDSDRTIECDDSVVRTSGDQGIGGTKSFSNTIQGNISGSSAQAYDLFIGQLPDLP